MQLRALAAVLMPRLVIAGLIGVATACEQKIEPQQAAILSRIVAEWFECEECEDGQLEAVVKQGDNAVPSLILALSKGPSTASRYLVHRNLDSRYTQLKEFEKKHPKGRVVSSREEFVARYVDNYDAKYRIRAAQALGEIGGPKSVRALESSLGVAKRADVRDAVEEALDKLRHKNE